MDWILFKIKVFVYNYAVSNNLVVVYCIRFLFLKFFIILLHKLQIWYTLQYNIKNLAYQIAKFISWRSILLSSKHTKYDTRRILDILGFS